MPVQRPITAKILEDARKGYCFVDKRWEGEEYEPNAYIMRGFLAATSKLDVGVYTGEATRWTGGKQITYKYYKVFVGHPKDSDLYAWWTPDRDSWADKPQNFDINKITWFEYQTKAA